MAKAGWQYVGNQQPPPLLPELLFRRPSGSSDEPPPLTLVERRIETKVDLFSCLGCLVLASLLLAAGLGFVTVVAGVKWRRVTR
jgi:hypothetical protein